MIIGLFAIDDVGSIGFKGRMPWPHNKDDMQWFKKITQNHVVVMGRRTWESPDMPKPLPGRTNVLFTNKFIERNDINQIRGNVCEALRSVQQNHKKSNIFVIGGANLLHQARPVLEKLYITRISGEYSNDTFINMSEFLDGYTLENTVNLGSCIVEEYNATISKTAKRSSRKRKTEGEQN